MLDLGASTSTLQLRAVLPVDLDKKRTAWDGPESPVLRCTGGAGHGYPGSGFGCLFACQRASGW